jgi:hypothetical protein
LLEKFFYWWGTGELQGVSEFSPQWNVSFRMYMHSSLTLESQWV